MTPPAGSFVPLGVWLAGPHPPADDPAAVRTAVGDLPAPLVVIRTADGFAVCVGGAAVVGQVPADDRPGYPLAALLPPLPASRLGDPTFLADHGVRLPYMTGAMANGIASVEVVEAACRAGGVGSFGAAGLSLGPHRGGHRPADPVARRRGVGPST